MRRPARVFRGDARVDRRDAEGRIRGTVLMILERPDRVRFDAMTQFGPAAVLTSDGETFALGLAASTTAVMVRVDGRWVQRWFELPDR